MRKQIFGRQLQRDINERKALFKSLMQALIEKESIQTTEAKAKAIKGQIEKLVTKAKVKGENTERQLLQYLSPVMVKKLIEDIAPRFEKRPGGYTRIIKLGNRLRDNAKMVILEWVVRAEKKIAEQETAISKAEVKTKKAEKPAADVVEGEIVAEKPAKKTTKKTAAKKTTKKK